MRIDLGPEDEPEIGLIALIDCIFFLLMFFMVATSFKQPETDRKTKDLPITLPVSTATLVAGEAAPDPLVITLDAQGAVSIDGRRLTLGQLHERLRAEGQRQPAPPIRIDGDRRAAYQHLVQVIDLAQFEGLRQVSLRTRP